MENNLIEYEEQQNEERNSDEEQQIIKFIDIDLRDIDSFGYMQQVFLENFSRSQYAKEYMPFWLYNRSQKYLEKQYKKKLKKLNKLYKHTLALEKKKNRKLKRLQRKQKVKEWFKNFFKKITVIFKRKKKEKKE